MIWREEYALGIEALDKQHQGLFIAVNSLSDLLKTSNKRRSQRACFEALKYLENYTVVHFKEEEEYQQSIGYINYAQHKRQHDAFLKTISYTKWDLTQSDFSDALSQCQANFPVFFQPSKKTFYCSANQNADTKKLHQHGA